MADVVEIENGTLGFARVRLSCIGTEAYIIVGYGKDIGLEIRKTCEHTDADFSSASCFIMSDEDVVACNVGCAVIGDQNTSGKVFDDNTFFGFNIDAIAVVSSDSSTTTLKANFIAQCVIKISSLASIKINICCLNYLNLIICPDVESLCSALYLDRFSGQVQFGLRIDPNICMTTTLRPIIQ